MLEKMQNLRGCRAKQVTVSGYKAIKLEIEDLGKWQENLNQLIPIFGKLIFEEFEQKPYGPDNPQVQEKALAQLKISFNDISYMFVLEQDTQFVGLIAMKVLKDSPKIESVIELIISPKYRGQGLAPELYKLIFKDKNFDAVISYSKNPAAVVSRYKVGKRYGYETYFGGMSAGHQDAIDLQNEARSYFQKEGIVADFPTPQGYVFLKGEENVNAPLKEGEAKFAITNPLYKPFREILELQKKNSKDTAVGLLVTIKKQNTGT